MSLKFLSKVNVRAKMAKLRVGLTCGYIVANIQCRTLNILQHLRVTSAIPVHRDTRVNRLNTCDTGNSSIDKHFLHRKENVPYVDDLTGRGGAYCTLSSYFLI